MDIIKELFDNPESVKSTILLHGMHSYWRKFDLYFRENPIEGRLIANSLGIPLGEGVEERTFAKIRQIKPEIIEKFTLNFNLP
jgi:hypothetical protein